MRIAAGKIYALRIPFVEPFAHSTKNRSFSDSFVVELTDENGATGYGEGSARPYVTGETAKGSIAYIKNRLFPEIVGRDFPPIDINADPLAALSVLTANLSVADDSETVVWNAALAAVEIALIDLRLKTQRLSLSQFLPPKREFVVYSGIIPTGSIEKAIRYARRFKLFGIDQLKIKIDGNMDVERVGAVRQLLGESASLRVDANGAYTVSEAIEVLKHLAPFNIEVAEQPIPPGKVSDLVSVKENSPIPIMVDESLITSGDAQKLIEAGACDYFNLRLSKCGGIARTLGLARLAADAGIKIQIGCQVGETAILSAAGRHVAAYLGNAKFSEGSFGNLLLAEDVSRHPINFGHGGRAPVLRGGIGIGVEIRSEILEKYADSATILRKYKKYAEAD